MQKLLKLRKQADTLLKYLLGAVILAVPLYPKFPFITVPGTFVSIRLEDLLIAILSIVLGVALLPNLNKFLRDKVMQAILIFIAVGFLSLVSAIFLTKSVSSSIGFLHWARRVEYLIPFFAARYVMLKDRSSLKFYFKLLPIIVGVAFLYGLGQRYLSWPVIITQNQEYAKGIALRWIPGSHINSTFAGHYDLASFLVLILPIQASGIFVFKSKLSKGVLTGVFLSGLWLMASAVSRISIASYLMSATLALIIVRKFKAIPLVVIVSIFIFSQTSAVITRYTRIIDVVRSKIVNQVDKMSTAIDYSVQARVLTPPPDPRVEDQKPSSQPEDRSSSIRLNVEWPRAIRAFSKNPLLGTGYSSITLATDNDYLRLLGESGLLGFLSFALVFIRMAEVVLKKLPFVRSYSGLELVFISGFIAAIPGIFVNAVFIDIFEASKFAIVFWMLAGFAYALLNTQKSRIKDDRN